MEKTPINNNFLPAKFSQDYIYYESLQHGDEQHQKLYKAAKGKIDKYVESFGIRENSSNEKNKAEQALSFLKTAAAQEREKEKLFLETFYENMKMVNVDFFKRKIEIAENKEDWGTYIVAFNGIIGDLEEVKENIRQEIERITLQTSEIAAQDIKNDYYKDVNAAIVEGKSPVAIGMLSSKAKKNYALAIKSTLIKTKQRILGEYDAQFFNQMQVPNTKIRELVTILLIRYQDNLFELKDGKIAVVENFIYILRELVQQAVEYLVDQKYEKVRGSEINDVSEKIKELNKDITKEDMFQFFGDTSKIDDQKKIYERAKKIAEFKQKNQKAVNSTLYTFLSDVLNEAKKRELQQINNSTVKKVQINNPITKTVQKNYIGAGKGQKTNLEQLEFILSSFFDLAKQEANKRTRKNTKKKKSKSGVGVAYYITEENSLNDFFYHGLNGSLGSSNYSKNDSIAGKMHIDYKKVLDELEQQQKEDRKELEKDLNNLVESTQSKCYEILEKAFEEIKATSTRHDFLENERKLMEAEKEQLEVLNTQKKFLQDLLPGIQQDIESLDKKMQMFNIHGSVKYGYGEGSGQDSVGQGFHGGTIGLSNNAISALDVIAGAAKRMNYPLKERDINLLKFIIKNSGIGLVAQNNKDPLQNYFEIFVSFLMFDDAYLQIDKIAQYVKVQNLSQIKDIHIYTINGIKYPQSYILTKVYETLSKGYTQILAEDKTISVSLEGYNVGNEEFEQGAVTEETWKERSQKAERESKIAIKLLSNYSKIMADLSNALNSF